jgi:GNAT superfamily N-acetyltransferase
MADKAAGAAQLDEYVNQLQARGHSSIVAPINGSTWHTYRLVSWCGGEPAFPMEPQNPLWYNDVYTERGFTPLKTYRSDKFSLEGIAPPRNTNPALVLRPFQGQSDLATILRISLAAFEENFLYDDITLDGFMGLYKPMLPMIDPKLLLIAEINGVGAGFMFSFAAGDKLILKSMGTLPQYRGLGIGSILMAQVLAAGRAKGLKTAVAALMSDDNTSHKIVSKYGSELIRKYTLYKLEV